MDSFIAALKAAGVTLTDCVGFRLEPFGLLRQRPRWHLRLSVGASALLVCHASQPIGIGYPSASSRHSTLASVPSWRQWLWPVKSLTENTHPIGTTSGVRPSTAPRVEGALGV